MTSGSLSAAALAALLGAAAHAQQPPAHAPRPGGVAVIELPGSEDAPTVRFEGKPVLVIRDGDNWTAVVGVPLDRATGQAALQLSDERRIAFEVVPHAYREQRLDVERRYVEPDAEQLDRIVRERERLDAALNRYRDSPPASLRLAAPVPGKRSPSFGFRRFFNDQPRRPHSGMDIAAGAGTPIRAPAAGVVSVTGDFYFNGRTVILDHGRGFVTLYCHLERIDVAEGDSIASGDTLGLVGATGRVTGTHLHFGTYLNGTAVDPGLFLDTTDD